MERASRAFVTKFLELLPDKKRIFIFCGIGNNGGDGLAIGRLLIERGWRVDVFAVGDLEKGSPDFKVNLKRLASYQVISTQNNFPNIPSDSIIIDGLFGSGLSRPVDGICADLIEFLNRQNAQRLTIDIPSGLYADQSAPEEATAFKADYTISFQVPKLVFFLPDCEKYIGRWFVVDIGLDNDFIQKQASDIYLTEKNDIKGLLPVRSTFTHKSQVGRLMLVAGSKGKMGAAVLCARAAFKAGAGLINVHAPSCGVDILQISIPEAMVSQDMGEGFIESIPDTEDTIAIGPGLGTDELTVEAVRAFLQHSTRPLVIDADGINILAKNEDIIKMLPEDSILTPHPGEFKRLVGAWNDDFDKLEKLRSFCSNYLLNIVLKGAFSAVCNTKGDIYFNPTGNPGLATAGSGDVLTGMTGALLAQGLPSFEALKLAVYLHGSAGDEAVRALQTPWIQATDIIDFIPQALSSLAST